MLRPCFGWARCRPHGSRTRTGRIHARGSCGQFRCEVTSRCSFGSPCPKRCADFVEGCIRLLEERHEHVAQDVLHAHAPRLRPHLLEHIHHAGSGERDAILPDMAQGIVAVWLVRIRRVEIDDVSASRRRDACGDARHEIAVRIDQREAVARAPSLGAPCSPGASIFPCRSCR